LYFSKQNFESVTDEGVPVDFDWYLTICFVYESRLGAFYLFPSRVFSGCSLFTLCILFSEIQILDWSFQPLNYPSLITD
jgi:hypothetical protein